MSGIKEKVVAGVEKLSAKLPGHHGHTGTTTNTTSGTGTGTGTNYSTGTGTGGLSDSKTGNLTGGGAIIPETKYESTAGHKTGDLAGTGTGTGYSSGVTGTGTGYSSGTTGTDTGYTGTGHHTTTGVGAGTATGGACIPETEIIDSKKFTKTTDEEVLIEKKKYELEHRPKEEEFVVETRKIGEQRVPGAATEVVGSDTREVEHRSVAAPRGNREVIVEDVDVPASEMREFTTETGTTGTGYGTRSTETGTTGTGTGTGYGTRSGNTY